VKEQTAAFLDKARQQLQRAETMFSVELTDDAGRAAYLAGLHAAQALIFENTDKIIKSHRGAQGELRRLLRNEPSFDRDLLAFLSRTYHLKDIADYETGPGAMVSVEHAQEAIQTGRRFVETIARLLPPNGPTLRARGAPQPSG